MLEPGVPTGLSFDHGVQDGIDAKHGKGFVQKGC